MSAGESDAERSELPTEHRRQQAREQGNIARSQDLTAALGLLAAIGALSFAGPDLWRAMGELVARSLQAPAWIQPDEGQLWQTVWQTTWLAAGGALPILVSIMFASAAASLAQTGFVWSPEVLEAKWERLNPLSGLGRIFSWHGVVRLAGSLGKLALLGIVTFIFLRGRLDGLLALSSDPGAGLATAIGDTVIQLGFWLSSSLVVLAVFDYGFEWWKHEQGLMMTKQEIREEMKEMDGNPETRARRRDAHRRLVEGRQMNDVKTADVVLTNPTHISIAIKYDPETMVAPTVVAKGLDEIALQIRRIAAENGVPIIERKPLARSLYKLVKVGQVVPVDMYELFVEILAYVYKITGRKPPVGR